ncbi:hypothetical protein ACS0TY_020299 [Phlomoides rotata]
MYMNDIETQINKIERNYEISQENSENYWLVFSETSRLIGKGTYSFLDEKSLKQVHAYALKNCDEVMSFISEHKEELTQKGYVDVEKKHDESFTRWSVQTDKHNCTSINVSRPWKTNKPYVLASQAQHVFYVNDMKLGNDWKIVIEVQARSLWSVLENKDIEEEVIHESYQQDQMHDTFGMAECSNDIIYEWSRNDIPTTMVDANEVSPVELQKNEEEEEEEEDDDDDDDDDGEEEEEEVDYEEEYILDENEDA